MFSQSEGIIYFYYERKISSVNQNHRNEKKNKCQMGVSWLKERKKRVALELFVFLVRSQKNFYLFYAGQICDLTADSQWEPNCPLSHRDNRSLS